MQWNDARRHLRVDGLRERSVLLQLGLGVKVGAIDPIFTQGASQVTGRATDLAIQGDEEARKIFRRVGHALGIVIADLVNALNLPMYVVGGGVSSAWEAFSPAIFDAQANANC